MRLTLLQASVIWKALVAICGASQSDEIIFLQSAQEERKMPLEFRFQGSLGFGGKIYLEIPPRVSCYSEDETPEGNKKIEHVNNLLAAIAKSWQITPQKREI